LSTRTVSIFPGNSDLVSCKVAARYSMVERKVEGQPDLSLRALSRSCSPGGVAAKPNATVRAALLPLNPPALRVEPGRIWFEEGTRVFRFERLRS
jgi:hypothetical protein